MLVQQQELARIRDLEIQHLQQRLQEAEEGAEAATQTAEPAPATLTQLVPPTPTMTA